jgi:hypothetical protein
MKDTEDDEGLSKDRSSISSSIPLPSSSSSNFCIPEQRDRDACDQSSLLPVGKTRCDSK